MIPYRCYLLDNKDRIAGPPREFFAENDGQALRIASEALVGQTIEVWEGPRLVSMITPYWISSNSDWIIVLKT